MKKLSCTVTRMVKKKTTRCWTYSDICMGVVRKTIYLSIDLPNIKEETKLQREFRGCWEENFEYWEMIWGIRGVVGFLVLEDMRMTLFTAGI